MRDGINSARRSPAMGPRSFVMRAGWLRRHRLETDRLPLRQRSNACVVEDQESGVRALDTTEIWAVERIDLIPVPLTGVGSAIAWGGKARQGLLIETFGIASVIGAISHGLLLK